MEQLDFPLAATAAAETPAPGRLAREQALGHRLAEAVGRPVELRLTRNRSTMVSVSRRGGGLVVRLHELFLEAGASELEALAAYLTGSDRDAGRVLDGFIETHSHRVSRPERRVRPRGEYHDLTEIFDEINAHYFHRACGARITWGSAGRRRPRRSIQLGVYRVEERLISIHPCLDQLFVPRFYVAWIVYHEMLHDVFGIARRGARRSMHPPEFSVLEQTYPDFARCKRWEEENLPRLLRYQPRRRS